MSKRKRRKFSVEFKEEAVKLITVLGYSIAEAARNIGINANQLGRWKREIENPIEGSSGSGKITAMQAELKRLRKKNKHLKMEREILKKAALSSTCQCNTLLKCLCWSQKSNCFPGSLIQLGGYKIKFIL